MQTYSLRGPCLLAAPELTEVWVPSRRHPVGRRVTRPPAENIDCAFAGLDRDGACQDHIGRPGADGDGGGGDARLFRRVVFSMSTAPGPDGLPNLIIIIWDT
jgi:hypothetical protein